MTLHADTVHIVSPPHKTGSLYPRVQPAVDHVGLQYLLLKKVHVQVDLCGSNPRCSGVILTCAGKYAVYIKSVDHLSRIILQT